MSTSVTRKRGHSPSRKSANRIKVRKIGLFDRFLKSLPFSENEIQRGFTWAVLAGTIVLLFVILRVTGVTATLHTQYAQLAARAGFEVKRVDITGMERVNQLKVYDLVLAEKDRAMPLVDVNRIRQDLLGYGWIRDARVTRRLPDTLVVVIEERKPRAVWQDGKKLTLVDEEGKVLENIGSGEGGGLPRLMGARANEQIGDLTTLMAEAPSLKPHIVGANWVGNRRWDLAFKSGETLALPEGEEASKKALLDFARMDGMHRLLGRDLIHFDFRDPKRAYLRRKIVTPPAPNESGDNDKAINKGDSA